MILVAGAVQSAIGFGYALVSTPLLIWLGIPLPQAITIVATCSFVQSCIGARHLRADVPWRLVLTSTGIRLVMVVAGIILLRRLTMLNPEHVKLVVGCVLSVLVIMQIGARVKPAASVHWAWTGLAFCLSGLIAGLCGMGGPPLVLWLLAHDWSAERMRGFLFGVFATSIPVQIIMLYLTFGKPIVTGALAGLLLAPVVYLGSRIGLPLGNRLGKERLRWIVYGVLLLIGLNSIIPPLLRYSVRM